MDSEEVGEGMCIWHLGLSDNHLGCDGSGDLSSNSDSVITLNLLVCKLLIPSFSFARSWLVMQDTQDQVRQWMLHAFQSHWRQNCHRNGELIQTSAFHISEIEGNETQETVSQSDTVDSRLKKLHSLTREFSITWVIMYGLKFWFKICISSLWDNW